MTTSEIADNHPRAGLSRGQLILYALVALIALIGLADASYLTVIHFTGDDAACGPSAGCFLVLTSFYSTVAGIPTAALGAAAYFAAFSCAIFGAFGYARAKSVLAVVVMIMFVAALGLLYVQAFILHAFCPFCLLSAALTFCLAGLLLVMPPANQTT